MPFEPLFTNYIGMLPFLTAAKAIIESDFEDALAWRCGLDGSTPGDNYAAVQFSHMHSEVFPLLVIQPGASNPDYATTGGMRQAHIFEAEIFITRPIGAGDPVAQFNAMAADLVRYLDATMWAFMAATLTQWQADLPAGANYGKLAVSCTDIVFGELIKGSEKESAGQYERSVAFELHVDLREAQS